MPVIDSPIRVLFGDTDALGIVYYANYLRYFEVGRAEWFRVLDEPFTHYIERDYFLVVIESHLRYHRPARYDQVIRIRTILKEISGARMRLDYQVVDHATGEVLVSGYTKHTVTDKAGKIRRFTREFKEKMQGLVNDGFD